MSRYIHDKVNHQLIPVSGYGSRMATSIEDKTLTIHGSYANVEGYNYGKADITDAVELIAPIETELVASRAYTIGKQFVYRGFLYKVTAPIALDETIVIGTNCELAPDVTEQIGSALKTIDTSNVIQSTITQQANMTYTATQDCAVVYTLVAYPTQANVNAQRNVLLNGVTIDGIGAQVTTAGAIVSRKIGNIIVKKGDIVTIQSGASFYSAYTVYGLK